MQIKCIIVVNDNALILHSYFCAISFNRTQNLHFPEKFGKISITALLKFAKYISLSSHKISILHENFVRFHALGSEVELPKEFWEKHNSSAPY